MVADKSLAAEIEARAVKAQAGLARAYELIADQYGTWSPENGTQFTDRGAAEAVEGIRLARELLAEIAALQSRAFEDGARWMRDRAAEVATHRYSPLNLDQFNVNNQLLRNSHGHDRFMSVEEADRHVSERVAAILSLPLQPEGERNA